MVKLVPLNRFLLQTLRKEGFNILKSASPLCSESPTYYPIKVHDVWEFLESDEILQYSLPLGEKHLLVIEDAINNIRDEDLKGVVIME